MQAYFNTHLDFDNAFEYIDIAKGKNLPNMKIKAAEVAKVAAEAEAKARVAADETLSHAAASYQLPPDAQSIEFTITDDEDEEYTYRLILR